MKNSVKYIFFTAIIGIFFSVSGFAQQKWDGIWKLQSRHAPATLKIKTLSKSKLKFEINSSAGANTGEISGTAMVSGKKATFKDSGSCRVTFTHTGNLIRVDEKDCTGYGGIGVYFGGEYRKGSFKKKEENFVIYEVFPNAAIDKNFKTLVGKDYEAFLDAFDLYGNVENEDSFDAKVFTGCVRGICPYNAAIIMFDEKGTVWSAFIAAGEKESTISYYTNSSDWTDKFPTTIENWVNDLRKLNENLKIIYKNKR